MCCIKQKRLSVKCQVTAVQSNSFSALLSNLRWSDQSVRLDGCKLSSWSQCASKNVFLLVNFCVNANGHSKPNLPKMYSFRKLNHNLVIMCLTVIFLEPYISWKSSYCDSSTTVLTFHVLWHFSLTAETLLGRHLPEATTEIKACVLYIPVDLDLQYFVFCCTTLYCVYWSQWWFCCRCLPVEDRLLVVTASSLHTETAVFFFHCSNWHD